MESSKGLSHYYVQLTDGDVHRVTLDQLDDAFQAGHIDESTKVLVDGGGRWTTLGLLAGIDGAAPIQPVSPRAAPAPRTAAPARSFAPQPARLPAAPYATPFASARPPPYVPVLYSHRPVSIDLSELETGLVARSGSGKRWFAALAGLAMVSACAAVAVRRPGWAQPYLARVGLHAAPITATLVAAAPPIAAPPPIAEAIPTQPSPAAATVPPAIPGSAPGSGTAIAKIGTSISVGRPQHGAKAQARKAKAIPPVSAHGSSTQKSRPAPFSTGGSKYDPLNSSI